MLVLKGVDMKWRSFSAGGEGAGQMQFFYTSAVARAVENESLTGMAQLQDKTSLTC
jgi:hypothetical protein